MANKKVWITALVCALAVIVAIVAVVSTTIGPVEEKVEAQWVTTAEPTCDKPGQQQRTLSDGTVQTRDIAPLGHDYTTEIRAPQCTLQGHTYYDCTRCDACYVGDFVAATGHSYGQWVTEKEATCTADGSQTKTCETCQHTVRSSVAALGHKYTVTLETKLETTYTCDHCGNTKVQQTGQPPKEEVTVKQEFDVNSQFSFDIVTDKGEEYIHENLKVIDAYFEGSQYEDNENVVKPYTLTQKSEGVWTITPKEDYDSDNAFVAKLSGELAFADYEGESLTFTTENDEPKENTYTYHETILFLKKLELENPGYYPYSLSFPENSEYIYLTLGKADGIEVGKILCVGEATDAQQVTVGTDCHFGKVHSVYPLENGQFTVVLAAPEITEIFAALDISFEDAINFDNAQVDTQRVGSEIAASFYRSEDFGKFLTAVNLAATSYAKENHYEATYLSESSFMDKVKITPTVSLNGTKLVAKLEGTIDLPLQNKNKKDVGSIKVGFTVDLESEFWVDVSYDFRFEWFESPLEYFDFCVTQTDTVGFTFKTEIDIDYSLQEGEYIQNTDRTSGKIHRRGCIHLTQVKDTTKLVDLSVKEAEKRIAEDPKLECQHCRPKQGFETDLLVVNTKTKAIHCYGCKYLEQMTEKNKQTSEEKASYWMDQGYTCCDWCHPDNRDQFDFQQRMAASLQYSDWSQRATDIATWAKDAGMEEYSDPQITLANVEIPIAGPVAIQLKVDFVLEFKLEASLSYQYKCSHHNRFGVRLQHDRVSTYSDKSEKILANDLDLMGKASFRSGVEVEGNLVIAGLSSWIRAGVAAETGIYAEASGIVHKSFHEDVFYAAARMEAGVYFGVSASYKLFDWENEVDILSLEIPLVQMGYDKAYHSYIDPVTQLSLTEPFDLAPLLKVNYFDVKEMTGGTETLQIRGKSGCYTVDIRLEKGDYLSVRNGVLIMNSDAPCTFMDTLTITVSGSSDWIAYQEGSAAVYLKDYVITVSGTNDRTHQFVETSRQEPTCLETGMIYYSCEVCGKENTETIPATGHEYDINWSKDETSHWHAPVCGDIEEVMDLQAHNYGQWTVIIPSTCTTEGLQERVCETCFYVERGPVEKLPHQHTISMSDNAGHWSECACGDALPKEEHSGEWVLKEASTCTRTGAESRTCEDCGFINSRSLPLKEHRYGTGWLSDENVHWHQCATCGDRKDSATHTGTWVTQPTDENGVVYKKLTCQVCEKVITQMDHAHTYSDNWSMDAANHWHACTHAGCGYTEDVSGHTFGNWSLKGDPTSVGGGQKARTCSGCGFTEILMLTKYKITFVLNGGTLEGLEGDTQAVPEMTAISFAPTKTGHTFAGWYTDSALTQPFTDTAMPSRDITLYAAWQVHSYTVHYDKGTGTGGSMLASPFTYGVPQNLRANAFEQKFVVTYSGLGTKATAIGTFSKWSAVIGGKTETYGNGAQVNNLTAEKDGNVYLTAQWIFGSVTLPDYNPTGYSLEGWYADKALTKLVGRAGDLYTPVGNVTLYPKLTAHTYKVVYDGNGATSGSTAATNHVYDQAQTLSKNGFVRDGYDFLYWQANINGAVKTFSEGSSVMNDLYSGNGTTVSLYAQWSPRGYSIIYDGNGATSGSMASTSHICDDGTKLRSNSFAKDGMVFLGWSRDKNATVPTWKNEAVSTIKPAAGETEIRLYAVWIKLNSTVSFSSNKIELPAGASHSETVYPGLDRVALMANGYKQVKITITFTADRKQWICYNEARVQVFSYQDEEVYDHEYSDVFSYSQETKTITMIISLEYLQTDGSFWVKWSTPDDGNGRNDGWNLRGHSYKLEVS